MGPPMCFLWGGAPWSRLYFLSLPSPPSQPPHYGTNAVAACYAASRNSTRVLRSVVICVRTASQQLAVLCKMRVLIWAVLQSYVFDDCAFLIWKVRRVSFELA